MPVPVRTRYSAPGGPLHVSIHRASDGRSTAGNVVFDPPFAVHGDVVVLCWNEAERLAGTADAVAAGRRPTVVAMPAIIAWLRARGDVDGRGFPSTVDGHRIDARTYRPIPYAEPPDGLWKIASFARDPVRAWARLRTRARLPSAEPVMVRVRLPDGRTVVHVGGALHRRTDPAILSFARGDVAIVAPDYGEERWVVDLARRLPVDEIVLVDVVGPVRASLGMPRVDLDDLARRIGTGGPP